MRCLPLANDTDRTLKTTRPGGRARVSLFLLVIFLWSFGAPGQISSPAAHAAETITAIEVSGNRSVETEVVRTTLELRKGESYDPGKADRSLKNLFATGLFADVRIDRRGTKLIVTVVENPIVASVGFEGNSAVDKSKVEAAVELKSGARFTRSKAQADVVKLRELYYRAGRLSSTVEPKITEKGEGRVDVTFVIKEGEVNKVDSITFRGNHAFSESQLRDVISTAESGWFDFLKSTAFYDPERLDTDRQMLRRHYLKRGYLDAQVLAPEATKNETGTGYKIVFPVDEGERYAFGTVTVDSSLPGIDTAKLFGAQLPKAGDVYNQELLEKSEERLMLALSEQSQPFARVRPVPTRDPSGRTVGIKFLIEEGPHIYVERIEIVGNTKTKDPVIRREVRIAEGDPVNAFMLERARIRIQALGFFKSVALKQRRGSAPDKVVILFEVVEQETIDLAFGAGYSSSEGVIGDISITERNLFGNGQWLRLKLAGSFTRAQVDVGFTEPRFLGTNIAAGFDLFYKDADYTTESSYKSQRFGGGLRLGIPLSDETTLGLNYKLSRSQIYDVGPDASAAIREAAAGGDSGTYWTSSVGYSVTYDTRNSKKMPTSGVYYTIGQDVAGLGGDVRYIRSVGETRGYYAVNDSVTLMGRAMGGMITGWGGDDVRLLDLFYKGGESVRGFAPSGLGPRDTQSKNQDALGGRMFYATTAETLFNVPGVTESTGIRPAVFVDAGALWGVNTTASKLPGLAGNSASPRISTGVGIAWDSPLGPLRLDYAIPLVKQASDKTQPFSFGLMPY